MPSPADSVTIKNKDGKADESVFGGYGATYTNADGTTKSEVITFSKGVAKFKLKDGQSVEIASLPLDTAYEVKETDSGGLVASWVGATGKISASQKATATCTNSRKTDQTQPTKTSGTSSRSLSKTGDETDPVAPMVAAAAAGMLIGAGFFMRHRRENA